MSKNIIKNRYEFVTFIQAKNCNPNGDPELDNSPRIDPITRTGYMTDVCFKRQIRDYVDDNYSKNEGMDIIIKGGTFIQKAIAEAVIAVNKGKNPAKGKNKRVLEAAEHMCKHFYDVRTFGGALSVGQNAGSIKGPVQVEFARSLDPVSPRNITITRNAYGKGNYHATLEGYQKEFDELDEDKKTGMGTKQFIPYGLYRVQGHISASVAEKTGFTEDDLNVLFEAIANMYNTSKSASKVGMSIVGPIVIFKHIGSETTTKKENREREAILGCYPAYKLFELVDVQKKDDVKVPTDYKDYNYTVNLSDLPKTVQVGFKYYPFDPIVWDKPLETDEWLKTK